MTCINKIYSVSVMIDSDNCNANCAFCAGKIHRKCISYEKMLNWEKNLESAIKLSARYGGWSLSITAAGEPTVEPNEVTKTLKTYNKCAQQGAYMPNVNLFTNGILLGDKEFCKEWLPQWKKLGLTNIAVSIHSPFAISQAIAYNVNNYPKISTIINNVRQFGIGFRATLLLQREQNDIFVGTVESYVKAIHYMTDELKIDNITSWPIGNPDGSRNKFTPTRWELFKIKRWLRNNAKPCHDHAWGGGVYDYNGNMIRITDYVTRHDPKKDFVRQLVVFPDGTTTYSWIKEGALCMK